MGEITQIGVISDTHGLLRPAALRQLQPCAMIIHAGDVGDPAILERLRQIAPVHVVRGNVDRGGWAQRVRLTEVVEVGEVTIFVYHGHVDPQIDFAAAGFDVVVSGHSHMPSIERQNGVLFLNPGSAGRKRFALPVTLAHLRISGGAVEAEIIDLLVDDDAG